jgi:hypothetical protein
LVGGRLALAGLALVVAGRPGEAALVAGGGGEEAVDAAARGRPLRGVAAGDAAAVPVCGVRQCRRQRRIGPRIQVMVC